MHAQLHDPAARQHVRARPKPRSQPLRPLPHPHPPTLILYCPLQDGKVRMYSTKTLQRANTSVPGLGAPITAIDVTYDGKWVLATTSTYLMVIKVRFTMVQYCL